MTTFQEASTSNTASAAKDYALALAAVASCTCLAVALRPLAREAPFLVFFPAVFLSLAIGGFRVALFSSVLTASVVDYLLIPPFNRFHLEPQNLAKEVFFIAIMGVSSWVFERARRRSEQSIRLQHKLLETAVASILITDAGHHVIYWNRGAERFYGWSEGEAIGKQPLEFLKTIYPEPLEDIDRRLKETGSWQGRLRRQCKDGHTVVIEASWALDRKTGYILQTGLDVTAKSQAESELFRVNRALNALSKVNQLLIHASGEDELLNHAVEIIVQQGGYPLAWIAIPKNDSEHSVTVRASAGEAVEYLSKISVTWDEKPTGQGMVGTALREGRSCVIHNFNTDPKLGAWRELGAQQGFQSSICLPLIVQGKTIAGLTLYAAEENAFEGEELALVSEIAADLGFGLYTFRVQQRAEEDRKSRILLEEQSLQAQKMEAVGRLAGGIAHDFNNLLMIIMAQTELLSMQLEGKALSRAEKVMKSARRAAELTSQLLAFSRNQIAEPDSLLFEPDSC